MATSLTGFDVWDLAPRGPGSYRHCCTAHAVCPDLQP